MKYPTTYSDWLDCFDALKEGTKDEEVIECIQKGSLILTASTAERFASHLNEVIQFRIKKASEKFSRAMESSRGDLNLLVSALLSLRKEFIYLIKFVRMLSVIPKNNIDILVEAIKGQANEMQESLEKSSVKLDRTGALASIIKRNRVNQLEDL